MTKTSDRSEREELSVTKLFQMFPDEVVARKWFEDIRWPNGERHCSHCGSFKISVVKTEKPMPYHCGGCRKYFSVRTGTAMQSSKLPMQKWVIAIYLMSTSVKGVSSMKLHRDLDITQKSAWMMAQKIHQGFVEGARDKLIEVVDVDEIYIASRKRNKHASKRRRVGHGAVGEKPFVGAKQRNGKIVAELIDKTTRHEFHGFINKHVKKGTSIYRGYWNMHGYGHQTVNYETFNHTSEKHFHRHVGKFVGRHNIRHRNALGEMVAVVRGMVANRLRNQNSANKYE